MPEADAPGDFGGAPADEPEAEDDAGGADAAPEDLFVELRRGRKVPLEGGPLTKFFEALDETKKEGSKRLVRILHYGDSHTAADIMPSAIRRALQSRFGDGGRGFVLLGKPWPSYRPLDIATDARGKWIPLRVFGAREPTSMDGRYGLCGLAVNAPRQGGSTFVTTVPGASFCNKASVFDVFYLKQRSGGKFDVLVDGQKKKTVNTRSSRLGSGFYRVELKEGRHRLEIRAAAEQKVRLFGVAAERKGPGVVYDTLGINGASFYTSLRWDGTLLAEQIAHRAPDLVITMYGANETDAGHLTAEGYMDQVRRVMSRFMSSAKSASCLMLGPPDRKPPRFSPRDASSRLELIIDAQRQVAEEIGCAFIDLREMMGGEGANLRWREKGLAQQDGVHLTGPGYRFLGTLISESILEAYDRRRDMDFSEQSASDKNSEMIQ